MSDTEATLPADPQAYVEQVMAEVAEEVRLRRASGDLPPKLERELDELFLAHSPVAGRGGDLGEALRMVDAATFIDPVVPVESERAAGAVVKKGMRSLLLWYVGWITHQMSQSASAVSRALHIVDDRLQDLERQVEAQRVPGADGGRIPGVGRSGRLVGRAGDRRRGQGPRTRPARGMRRRVAGAAHRSGRRRCLRRRSSLPRRGQGRARHPRSARRRSGRAPARRRRGRPGRHRAERHRGRDGRWRAHPVAHRHRRPGWRRAGRSSCTA